MLTEARFEDWVDRGGECHLGRGSKDRYGYGVFWDGTVTPAGNPRTVPAHRYAWYLATGRHPIGQLGQTCTNTSYVRTDHLQVKGGPR